MPAKVKADRPFVIFKIVAQYLGKYGEWQNIYDPNVHFNYQMHACFTDAMEYINSKKNKYKAGTKFRVAKITETTIVKEITQ